MKQKIYQFMQGRYGSDQFNRFLMILALVLMVLSMFGVPISYLLGMICMVYAYFRLLSRNIDKRRTENNTYLKYEYKVRQKLTTWKREGKQRKTHHIYKCPSCQQKLRIPRGKGKIEIRCPKCNQTFVKRS